MPFTPIPRQLLEKARSQPEAPAYHVRQGGAWVATSWGTYAAEVRQVARALIALGVKQGGTTCILGFNRPEWVIFDVATMAAGAAPAGIYTTCSPDEVQYIVHHAEAPVVLVENESQWKKIAARRDQLPHLRHVVTMKGAPKIDDPLVMSWEQLLAKASEATDADVDARIDAIKPDDLATLIYTSGTTGPPKGVMLSQMNLSWTGATAVRLVEATAADRVLSYLPLSHIAEQMFTIHGAIGAGYAVYYAESVERLKDNLPEVKPTLFFGVPRIWEKLHSGVAAKLALATGVKAKLAGWALKVGAEAAVLRCRGELPSGLLGLQYKLADKLVLSKIRAALGLDEGRCLVSGAAPIGREVLEFLASLGIIVQEVYGQSEDTGPTTINQPGRIRFGTVGPRIDGIEVKFGDDGEILVRGPNVFLGYYKDPEATAATLVDGWLQSGDLGRFDEDGYLHITGRKKEILITAGGKNITPKNIEEQLMTHPLIGQAMVIGDRRKYLTAVITLEPEAAAQWASEHGVSPASLPSNAALRALLQAHVDQSNTKLSRVEEVKKFTILPGPFSIENGELTPTLKLKRRKVLENYAAQIEAMYE